MYNTIICSGGGTRVFCILGALKTLFEKRGFIINWKALLGHKYNKTQKDNLCDKNQVVFI